MNIAARQKSIKLLDRLYPLPGSKASPKYSILTPDAHHVAICQPFMGSAARSLGSHLPSYLGDINAAQRAIASAWRSPAEFTAAYEAARDRLVKGFDLNLLKQYKNQGPLEADHPEIFRKIKKRWDEMQAELFAEMDQESVGLAGRYYFSLKTSFGQVVRNNPKGTGFNSSWSIDKLNGAIRFSPLDWCLRMAHTPFDATIYDCWEKAIAAPPDPANTLLILDPPYGVDTKKSKITACYHGHQISANGQNDTLLDLAIEPLTQAIALGYQTIYLCNYRSEKLESAIEQITQGYTVTRHDFGECGALGNSNGRLKHGNRKDNRERGQEAIWEIRFDRQFEKLIESPNPTPITAPAEPDFDQQFEKLIEKIQGGLDQSIVDICDAIDLLSIQGVASMREALASEEKGGKVYHRVIQGGRSKAIKPGEVADYQARIKRRKQSSRLSTVGDRINSLRRSLDKFRS